MGHVSVSFKPHSESPKQNSNTTNQSFNRVHTITPSDSSPHQTPTRRQLPDSSTNITMTDILNQPKPTLPKTGDASVPARSSGTHPIYGEIREDTNPPVLTYHNDDFDDDNAIDDQPQDSLLPNFVQEAEPSSHVSGLDIHTKLIHCG